MIVLIRRWASLVRVQIEIEKVMKTGVDNRAPLLSVRLEGKCQVECAPRKNACARYNYATGTDSFGNRIRTFMGV